MENHPAFPKMDSPGGSHSSFCERLQ
jgi:hypothetical protein